MFAYCGNNPISFIDKTGTYYTPGQIHNFVVKDICDNNENKTGDRTYMTYREPVKKGKKFSYFGYCDIYDVVTHEIWEVKRINSGPSCTLEAAITQLSNYVMNGILQAHTDWDFKTGGTVTKIPANCFTVPDNDGGGVYVIGYWDAGAGIVFYDYMYFPSGKEILIAGLVGAGILSGAYLMGSPLALIPAFA